MVAPLIVAGARLAGTQLAKKGAMRAAGAQLARGEAVQAGAGQLAKTIPQAAEKQVTSAFKAPIKENGAIGGNLNLNKNNLVGDRLQPKKNIENQSVNSNIENSVDEEENQIQNNYYNPENISQNRPMASKRPRLSGVDFVGALLVVAAKDVLDVFLEIIGFIFDALVVTMPLGVFLEIIDAIADFIVLIVTQGYLFLNGVPMTGKKVGIQGFTTLVELVPFLGVLPVGTISFLYLVKKVNKEREDEEKAEQDELDQQFEEQQNTLLSERMSTTTQISENEITEEGRGNENDKPKSNDWKEMVDNSNQNITKPTNPSNPQVKKV